MEFLTDFIQNYGMTIVMTILTTIATFIGNKIKTVYENKVQDDTKKKVVEDTCKYVEQIYKDLNGEEKLLKAISSATEMLNEKGINITDLELRILIESTVNSFKISLTSDKTSENVALEEKGE